MAILTRQRRRQRQNLLNRLLAWLFNGGIQHPGYLLYNTEEQVDQAPLPLFPVYFDIRINHLCKHYVLRPPYGEGDLNYWPRESDIEFERAINRTSQSYRDEGLFWFVHSIEEATLAYEEMALIRELRR